MKNNNFVSEQPLLPNQLDEQLGQANPALATINIYLGQRLGFYEALAGEHPLTGYEIAVWTGADLDFVQVWLNQQTEAGILDVENPAARVSDRRYHLSSLPAEVEITFAQEVDQS